MIIKQHCPYTLYQGDWSNTPPFKIYCDGAFFAHCATAGWAFIVTQGEQILTQQSDFIDPHFAIDSLKAELYGALKALEWQQTHAPTQTIELYVDAQILIEGLFHKYPKWQSMQFKKPTGERIKHANLWQPLYEYSLRQPVKWFWVKGHNQQIFNQLADQLARKDALNSPRSYR